MNPAPEIRKRTYKVKIFHQTYTITSSASEGEFQQIADHVDHLMQTISSRSGSTDGTRAAVMAAMHLADKLRQAERRLESIHAEQRRAIEQVDERTGDLERLLRETLAMEEEPRAAIVFEVPQPEPPEAETLASVIVEEAVEEALSEEHGPAPPEVTAAESNEESVGAAATPARTRSRRDRAPAAPTLFAMGDEADTPDAGEEVPF